MRQLLAIQQSGSFAKAAQALGMSQPSLSNAIARLEDQLKVRLFDRTSAGSQLTPIGELIAERAGKVIAESEQIIREAGLVAGGEAGQIVMGVGTALRTPFLSQLIVRLAEHYPQLSIRVEVLDQDRLIPLLRAHALDLIICGMGLGVAPDLVATAVLQATAVAAASPDHPLANETNVSVQRFCEFPGAGPALKDFSNARLFDQPDTSPVARYSSNDYDPLIDLAVAGQATLIAPMFVIQPYIEDGRLKLIDLDWRFKVTFAALTTRVTSLSPVVSRIIGHAMAVGQRLA